MPEERIFLFRKDKGWKDATSDIRFCDDKGNHYYIAFKSGKAYHFSYTNVRVLQDIEPIAIDDPGLFSAYFGIKEPAMYSKNGKRFLLHPNECLVEISERQWEAYHNYLCIHKNAFDYFYSIAKVYDSEDGGNFMASQYDKARSVWKSESALTDVLNGTLRISNVPLIIYPFAHNLSQMTAIRNGFAFNISVIQGPPGTGKTQTILNLIANIIYQGKNVAVISNNNRAVLNVYEKLDSAGYGFLCANLGNLENRKLFFSKKHEVAVMRGGPLAAGYNEMVQEEESLFEKEAKQSKLLEEREKRFLESKKYSAQNEERKTLQIRANLSSEDILNLAVKLEDKHKEKIGFLRKIRLFFRFGVRFDESHKGAAELSRELRFAYVKRKIEELDGEIENINKEVEEFEAKGTSKKIRESSIAALNGKINERYRGLSNEEYDVDNFKSKFRGFIQRYPVILSSTYSLPTSVPSWFSFDYIIIDESSQSTITTVLPSLTKGKRLVVIGDDQQLPPVIPEAVADHEESVHSKYGVNGNLRDDGKSFLAFIQNQMLDNMVKTILREHYRCALPIISFSNERVYHHELIIETKPDEKKHLRLIKTVPGNHARRSDFGGSGQYNQREIDEVVALLDELPKEGTIGVITPYRRQAELLRERLPKSIEVGTIHTFQGRECDTIILSTVANSSDDYVHDEEVRRNFVNDERMINVAVTRAKDRFILVTSDKIAHSMKGVLADLVKYIAYQTDSPVSEGKVHSIFDLLYDDYADARKKILHGKEIASEELMANLLLDVLKEERFSSLSFSMHVALKDTLKIDKSKYSQEEARYLTHPWTHLDFVVFNRFDKEPLLAIEVDGIAYHEQREKQVGHDKIKDRCLQDCGLSILRVKTNGSNERDKIAQKLESVMCA